MLVAHAIDVDLAAHDRAGLLHTCLAYVGVVAFGWLATLGARIALEIAAQRAMLDLKQQLFDHLVDHDVAFHDEVPSGSLIGRIQGDIEALRILFVEVVLSLPADLALMVGMLVVLLWQAGSLAWPVVAMMPAQLVLFWLFRRIAPPLFVRQRAAVSRMTATLTDTIRSLPALRALDRHRWARDRAVERIGASYAADITSGWQPMWYFNAIQAVRAVATTAMIVYGSIRIAHGAATVGLLVMGLAYLRQLFAPLMRLSNHLATLERARASAVRLADLLDRRPTLVDAPGAVDWPGVRSGVALTDVTFRYTADAPVLRGVTIEVPAGARVGIVGPTGSGKSTIVDLVLRFRDPDGGAVTVDGVDLRSIRVSALRDRTALVLQDVRLLPGTVLDNLGCAPEAARAALDSLGAELPLDRRVDDDSLSRGERQLVTFARAVVRDPDLLVLDEATSAVDPVTEAVVQRALDRLMSGRTVLVIAHRLETVRRCDRIYVLSAGAVVEHGTHAELVARNGVYAELVRLQAAA